MLDLQSRFAGKVGLPKRAFGSMELLSDDVIGQSGRFVGERGCRGSPAGRDRVAGCELPSLIEVAPGRTCPGFRRIEMRAQSEIAGR